MCNKTPLIPYPGGPSDDDRKQDDLSDVVEDPMLEDPLLVADFLYLPL